MDPTARRNIPGRTGWSNVQAISPLPGTGSPNLREVLEPWNLLQTRARSGPVVIASFPGEQHFPGHMFYPDNDAARITYQRPSPEPTPTNQGRRNVQAPEGESRLTQDEQKQTLNKLRKEIYFPVQKRPGKRPNLYFREYSMKDFTENRKENDEDGKRCAICLDDFEPREVVTVTPCKHMFHEDCITPWVKSQARCPVCRYAI